MVELNSKSIDNKVILTIGCQLGSGGREIEQRLTKELGISYYDKELITVMTRGSGLCEDILERAGERAPSGLSYAFTMGYSSFMGGMFTPYNNTLSNGGLFKVQNGATHRLAEIESCALIRRCADCVLRDDPACLGFFIHSSMEGRVRRAVGGHGVTVEEAKNMMEKTDKFRAAYYNYYMNKTWGMVSPYNFLIDVSILGIDEAAEFMKNFIERGLNKCPFHFG